MRLLRLRDGSIHVRDRNPQSASRRRHLLRSCLLDVDGAEVLQCHANNRQSARSDLVIFQRLRVDTTARSLQQLRPFLRLARMRRLSSVTQEWDSHVSTTHMRSNKTTPAHNNGTTHGNHTHKHVHGITHAHVPTCNMHTKLKHNLSVHSSIPHCSTTYPTALERSRHVVATQKTSLIIIGLRATDRHEQIEPDYKFDIFTIERVTVYKISVLTKSIPQKSWFKLRNVC